MHFPLSLPQEKNHYSSTYTQPSQKPISKILSLSSSSNNILQVISKQKKMANPRFKNMSSLIKTLIFLALIAPQVNALMPYTRSLWDMMLPSEDPFRILEQSPLTIPKGVESLALARADWKETPTSHVISMDIPGIKKDGVKIEVEENRVLRVSGERKGEEEVEGEKWHRAERINGKFWRQFRLPNNADLEHIKAHLEDGVLRITVPKFAEQQKKQAKVIDIAEQGSSGQDIKATKAEM